MHVKPKVELMQEKRIMTKLKSIKEKLQKSGEKRRNRRILNYGMQGNTCGKLNGEEEPNSKVSLKT